MYSHSDVDSSSFPIFDKLKIKPLAPQYPSASPRYGDPSNQNDWAHYILHQKCYPPERILVRQAKNSLMERSNVASMKSLTNCSTTVSSNEVSYAAEEKCEIDIRLRKDTTKFGSRRLINKNHSKEVNLTKFKECYSKHTLEC